MKRGFTIIEVLVTIVIVAMLGIVIVQSFITTITTSTKTELIKDVKQSGDYVLEMISRRVRNADTLDCTTANEIRTVNQDNSQSRFYSILNSGVCRIAEEYTDPVGAVTTNYLSADNLTAGDVSGCSTYLSVSCTMIASQYAKAAVSFSLQQKPAAGLKLYEQAAQKFETTISLRNVVY